MTSATRSGRLGTTPCSSSRSIRRTLWRDGGRDAIDLGRVPAVPGSCSSAPYWHKSIARAVNNAGLIVGDAMCIASSASRAGFLWEDGVMHNLNDLIPPATGWTLTGGRGISDAGRIVGLGTAPNGELHGFLLEPILRSGDLNCDGGVTNLTPCPRNMGNVKPPGATR